MVKSRLRAKAKGESDEDEKRIEDTREVCMYTNSAYAIV